MRSSHSFTRFSGINTIDSHANTKPHYAIDCNNVMGGPDGQLWQARLTRILIDFANHPTLSTGRIQSMGVLDTSAMGNPPRLVIQQGPALQYADSPDYANLSSVTNIVAPVDPGRLDYAQSASVLYFSSGTFGGKLLPNDPSYYKWGIAQPSAPPVAIVSTSFVPGGTTIERAGGVSTITFTAPPATPAAFVGDPIYVDADQWDASFSGTFAITGVAGNVVTYSQPGLPDVAPFTRASFGPGLTAPVGYQYRISYGFDKTVHWSTASAATATIGPLTLQSPAMLSPVPPDPQVNRIALWRNLDDGGDWYLVDTFNLPLDGPFPRRVAMLDTTTDDTLEASAQTPPYDNGVSPNGRFLCPHLDRILMCGVLGDTEAVYFSGFDSINFGRPQESWPFYNRISIGQGQASPNAIGITRYGAAIFCRNKAMYLVRGTLSDITTSAVTQLSFTVTELPFQIGNYSHYATQSTPLGTIFLSDSFNLMVFDGYDPPQEVAPVLSKILQRITPGSTDVVASAYITNSDRSWYVLSIPVDGSLINNLTIILDLNSDADRNSGAWVTSYAFDHIVSVLNLDGTLHLLAAQTALDTVAVQTSLSGIVSEVPLIYAPGDALMPSAHWRCGYFGIKDDDGIDEWAYYKLFRFVRLANAAGIRVVAYMVDGDDWTFDNPLVKVMDNYKGQYVVNLKCRAISLDLQFPDQASGDPITILTCNWNLLGKR